MLIFGFLSTFETACHNNSIHEWAAMCVELCYFSADRENALETKVKEDNG